MRIDLSPWAMDVYRTAAPLVVAAPAARCGAGVVQRLLNATGAIVVYGHDPLLLRVLPDLALDLTDAMRRDGARHATRRARFAAGALAEPAGDLGPAPAARAAGGFEATLALVARYAADARALGHVHWGLVQVGDVAALARFRTVVPGARVLFVTRALGPALASAKGQGLIAGGPQAEAYARRWTENMAAASRLTEEPWFLSVAYEGLAGEAEAVLDRIERFADIGRIDRRVLAHLAPDVPPAALDADEARAVDAIGGAGPSRAAG